MAKKEQIIISLSDKSATTQSLLKWRDKCFRDANGNPINNMSYHVRLAMLKYACPHLDLPETDPRFTLTPDETVSVQEFTGKGLPVDTPDFQEDSVITDRLDAL